MPPKLGERTFAFVFALHRPGKYFLLPVKALLASEASAATEFIPLLTYAMNQLYIKQHKLSF